MVDKMEKLLGRLNIESLKYASWLLVASISTLLILFWFQQNIDSDAQVFPLVQGPVDVILSIFDISSVVSFSLMAIATIPLSMFYKLLGQYVLAMLNKHCNKTSKSDETTSFTTVNGILVPIIGILYSSLLGLMFISMLLHDWKMLFGNVVVLGIFLIFIKNLKFMVIKYLGQQVKLYEAIVSLIISFFVIIVIYICCEPSILNVNKNKYEFSNSFMQQITNYQKQHKIETPQKAIELLINEGLKNAPSKQPTGNPAK